MRFFDNAPLEERRTQAVYTRRAGETSSQNELGILDAAAIERVCEEAWPRATNVDELHEMLLQLGVASDEDLKRGSSDYENFLKILTNENRAGKLDGLKFWVAAERLPMIQTIYQDLKIKPTISAPEFEAKRIWECENALRELIRGRMEILGPTTIKSLAEFFQLPVSEVEQALLALEAEGFVLRGKFHPGATETEWCDRRLLARIHRLTINRLRAEIQPGSIADFERFLLAWQHVTPESQMEEIAGIEAILHQLDGYELPATAWEPAVLAARVKNYDPRWLDQLCLTGRVGWGRLSPPQNQKARAFTPLRSSPIALFARENSRCWREKAAMPQKKFPRKQN